MRPDLIFYPCRVKQFCVKGQKQRDKEQLSLSSIELTGGQQTHLPTIDQLLLIQKCLCQFRIFLFGPFYILL